MTKRRDENVTPSIRHRAALLCVRLTPYILASITAICVLLSLTTVALWDSTSRLIAADIAVNKQPFAVHAPTETTRNLTTEAILQFISQHCKEVDKAVLDVWLRLARVDPLTRMNTLHVAFLGDSLCYRQFRFTVTDIDVCLNRLSPLQPSMVNCREPRAPTEANAVFLFRLPDPQKHSGSPANASVPSGHVESVSMGRSVRKVKGWARLVISYHRVRYAVELREVMETLYLPPKTSAHTALDPVSQKPPRMTWPSFPTLPAPQILYTGAGTWDSTRPSTAWDGFNQVDRDWYAAKDAHRLAMQAFEAHILENFTRPFTLLLSKFAAEGRDMGSHGPPAMASQLHALPFPHFYVLSTAPMVNCSAKKFQPRPSSGPQDVYQHLLTTDRCQSLVLPPFETVRGAFKEVIAAVPSVLDGKEGDRRKLLLLDWGDKDGTCARSDGIHLDDLALECRMHIWRTFWSIFLS